MAKRVEWQIPLLKNDQVRGNGTIGRKAGSLLHYESGDYDRWTYDADGKNVENVEWVARDYKFHARLGLHDWTKGRSAVFVTWMDIDTGRDYSMMFAEFFELVQEGLIVDGMIEGEFEIKKQGTAYGIYLLR